MADDLIREELLEVLACPACEDRPNVEMVEAGIRCVKCGRVYPIEDGIPIMIVEKAVTADN